MRRMNYEGEIPGQPGERAAPSRGRGMLHGKWKLIRKIAGPGGHAAG